MKKNFEHDSKEIKLGNKHNVEKINIKINTFFRALNFIHNKYFSFVKKKCRIEKKKNFVTVNREKSCISHNVGYHFFVSRKDLTFLWTWIPKFWRFSECRKIVQRLLCDCYGPVYGTRVIYVDFIDARFMRICFRDIFRFSISCLIYTHFFVSFPFFYHSKKRKSNWKNWKKLEKIWNQQSRNLISQTFKTQNFMFWNAFKVLNTHTRWFRKS